MIRAIPMLQNYFRAFKEAVEIDGWRIALRRAAGFIHGRFVPKLRSKLRLGTPEPVNPIQDIIGQLKTMRADRPLLMIVSDIQIKQCVHYRIQQKLRYLQDIGIRAMHISPAERGRLRAFLGLAHTVIVYRTALDEKLLNEFREAGTRILFEFDDLVVGRNALEASGILTQLTDRHVRNLRVLSEDFLKTAQACDAIIVSTASLAELYALPGNGLSDKPCFVVPNFVETDTYPPPGEKNVTFAYTSPSGSIGDELEMLKAFLTSYDAVADRDWSILIMGNRLAQKEIESISFRRGRVTGQPFSAFDDYLRSIAFAETVLIPLSDSSFNRSKTSIRLMDAAISGTQALFCPVGAYRDIQAALRNDGLCIAPDAWGEAGAAIGPALAQQETNVADLQQAVRRVYGTEAARACYRQVFLEGMGLQPTTEMNASAA